MKHVVNAGVCVVIAMVFVACAKSEKLPGPGANDTSLPGSSAQNLLDKSTQEVLREKYNKAVLICNLWAQYGADFIQSNPPNDSLSWDLLNDLANEKSFSLAAKIQDQELEYTLAVTSVNIQNTVLHDGDGTVYRLEYSPVVRFDYDVNARVNYGEGQFTSVRGTGRREVKERVRDIGFQESRVLSGEMMKYFNYVECFIDTDIKPAYQNQFSVESRR